MGRKRRFLGNDWLFNFFIICFISLSLGISVPVFAANDEEEDEEEFTLEEITVTAEKREAELQKVPIDIAVLRPDEMDKSGVYSIYDIKKLIPDLDTSSTTGNQVMISIRGVGGSDLTMWNPIHETTAAVHIDGVQLTRQNGFDNMFYDLQRVEVLKGPQGTLYGRGSTAGSMNILTQKPILDELGGYITLEAGNYGLLRAEAALNVPVTEKLAFRIAGRSFERDGYTDYGDNNADNWGGRLSMTWEPTDKDTITATFDRQASDSKGYGNNGTYLATYGNAVFTSDEFGTTTVVALPYKSNWWKAGGDEGWVDNKTWGTMAQWEREFSFAYSVLVYGHRELEEELEYPIGYTWATAYDNFDDYSIIEQPSGNIETIRLYYITPYRFSHSFSEGDMDSLEYRLLSKEDINQGDRYEWVIGALAQDDYVYEINDLGAYYWTAIKTRSYGLFAQGAYKLTDSLNLTVGYRHEIDKKEYRGNYGLDEDLQSYYNPDLYTDYISKKWSEDTYKINLNWMIKDGVMTFIQYSKGYKTGNINYGGVIYEPEYLDDYEIGFKTRFLDNRLQINGAAYYYDYKNYTTWATAYKCTAAIDDANSSLYYYSPDGICWDVDYDLSLDTGVDYEYYNSIAISAGGSKQVGGNLNIIYLLTANDTLNFNGSYSDNEYVDYNIAEAILAMYPDADNARLSASLQADKDGEKFGPSPYRFNVGYTRTQFIGMDMMLFSVSAFYTGDGVDQWVRSRGSDGTYYEYAMPGISSYWTIDASLTYTSSRWVPEGTSWTARLWGMNLLGKEALSSISYYDIPTYVGSPYGSGYTTVGTDGWASGYYITPRTYGITLTFEF